MRVAAEKARGLGVYLGYGRIQRALGATPIALILYLAPIYTALMAWLLLRESLEPYHLVGASQNALSVATVPD